MKKNINYKEIEGITPPIDFQHIINSKAMTATSINKAFSLFVFEVNSIYSDCLSKDYNLYKLVSRIIYKNVRRQDMFTVDNQGRFFILFSDTSPISVYMPIGRILDNIRKNLGDFVEINIGSANCPKDGINFESLTKELISSLYNAKAENPLYAFKDICSVNLPENVKKSYFAVENNKANFNKLSFLVDQVNKFSKYLKFHTARVVSGSINLAQELNMEWVDIEKIAIAAILHDVGYTIIPPIYFQSGNYDKEASKVLKMHPILASERLLKPLGIFDKYIPLIENHHELLDGSGFPRSKKGHQIDTGAQIISIVDSYCALVVENAGQKKYDIEDIIDIYIKNSGIKWDVDVVTSFSSMLADPKARKTLLKIPSYAA